MFTDLVNFSDPEWEDINVVAGALKLFLEKLPDPLIPYSLYNKFIEAGSKNAFRCYLLYSLKFWKTKHFHGLLNYLKSNLHDKVSLIGYPHCIYIVSYVANFHG